MSDAIAIQIPGNSVAQIVNAQIKLAVAESLQKNPDGLINRIVDEALRQKKDSYHGETYLDEAIKAMIKDAAKDALKEWIEANRPKIHRQLLANLKSVDGLVAKVAERLIAGLSQNMSVTVYIGKE